MPQPAPARRPEHTRDSWYIGFGLGGGGGTVSGPHYGSNSLDYWVGADPTQLALDFQVGATLAPSLLLGLDVQALGAFSKEGGMTSQSRLTSYDVAATWFPMQAGFFLKAGVGLYTLTMDAEGLGPETWGGPTRARREQWGLNMMGGVGYAFWIGRTFNLTLNLDATAARFGSDEFESAQMTNVYLGFMWN